jgi:predicted dehydrogenase
VEKRAIVDLVVFAVTHNYTGYPLVRQARDMARGGELGEIHAIHSWLEENGRGGKRPARPAP